MDEGQGRTGGPIGTLLRLRLFYKLLFANSAIIVLGAILGTLMTAEFVRAEPQHSTAELVGWFGMAGVVVSVVVNAAILRLALRPLDGLESVANAVREGDLDARAPLSPLADREFSRLTETFNDMVRGSRSTGGGSGSWPPELSVRRKKSGNGSRASFTTALRRASQRSCSVYGCWSRRTTPMSGLARSRL